MIKITQEELNIILDNHNKYLNEEEGGERADLYKKDCSGLDFSSNNLRCIYLDSCNLTNCNFSNCNLEYACLFNTNLTKANFTNANLMGAELVNSNLTGANLTNTKGLITTEDHIQNFFKFIKFKKKY